MPKILEPLDLPPRSIPWARDLTARVGNLEGALARLDTDLRASNKGLAAALSALGDQIRALPILASSATTASPINAISSSWTTKATVTIPTSPGKNTASLSIIGSIALLDTVTGGIAAPPSARFLVNGVPYPLTNGVPAAKDSGVSQVNNVVTLGAAVALSVGDVSEIIVDLQVSVFHSSAYATNSSSNFATLSAQAIFS